MYRFLRLFLFMSMKTNMPTPTPKCADCVHYIPSLTSMNFTSDLNKCNLFYEIRENECNSKSKSNRKSTILLHEYADLCRADEAKCGEKGVFFVRQRFLTYKIFLHGLLSRIPLFLLFSSLGLLISITDYIHNQ
jgi:hypothetical protein